MPGDLALPWGRLPEEKQEDRPTTAHRNTDEGHLCKGQRIQVEWQLSDDDGNDHMKWWGAELLEPSQEDAHLWKIRYDASDGFDPEEATVRIISADTLERQEACCTEERILRWRGDGEASEDEEDATINIHTLQAEHDQMERDMGQSLEQTALEHLQQQVTPDQQQYVLAGFRQFADHFKTQLQELVETKEDSKDYVITASDVQNILGELKK